MGGPLDILI